jgi:hypothetical protein
MLFVRESSNKCHLYLPGNWLIYFAINRPCAGADGFHLKIPQNGQGFGKLSKVAVGVEYGYLI